MTDEENQQIRYLASESNCIGQSCCQCRESVAAASMEWMKKQMIEKAVEWLKSNIKCYLECDGYSECPDFKMYVTDDFYEDFKKAMEE